MKFVKSLVFLNLIFLFACSGGTGGTGFGPGGSGSVVVGAITQISSAPVQATAIQQVVSVAATGGTTVTINGIQFDVSSSAITLDGVGGTDADLRVGMIATVKGTVDTNGTTGIADTVSVKEVIKGPVENIDSANNTLTVLGQTVQTSAATHWDNNITGIGDITNGDIIKVSGYVKNNTVIAATRVELLTGNEKDFKVTGSISNLNTSTFNVGSLVVDYSKADLSGVPNGTLTNDMFVEVKGTQGTGINQLVASQVNTEKLEVSDVDSMELQGFVTSGMSGSGFSVNHQPVQTDINTQFNGGTAADIVSGVLVSVQGPLVNGVLLADQVSFEDPVKITAVVNTVGSNSFTLIGLDTLTINSDASTEFYGGISDISKLAGETVTVHGNLTPPGNITATQITLASAGASPNVSLQGPIDAIASDSVTIVGVNVRTALLTDADYIVEGYMNNSRSYFFSVVNVGSVVTAQGLLNNSAITWQSLTYENPM